MAADAEGGELSLRVARLGWKMLLAGVITVAAVGGLFGLYALLLVLISLVSCLVCPCLGAGAVATTAGLWATMLVVCLIIGAVFLGAVAICGVVGLVLLPRTSLADRGFVMMSAIAQVLIGGLGVAMIATM